MTLEGATIDPVPEQYKRNRAWEPLGCGGIVLRRQHCWTGRGKTEHHFCMRANEASLESVLDEAPQSPRCDGLRCSYVDLVDVDWEPPQRSDGDSDEEYFASPDQGNESMEG